MPGTRHRNNLPNRTPTAVPRLGLPTQIATRLTETLRSRPRRSVGAGLLTLAAIAGTLYLVWPAPHQKPNQPAARTRTYTNYTACLLTDSTGIAGIAAPVWAGMQAASSTTHERVNYLAMQGAGTAANADNYINTLALRGCDIILATGTLPDQAVTDRAAAYPKVRFITITEPPAASALIPSVAPVNVTTITETTPSAAMAAVRTTLIRADLAGRD